MWQLLKFNFLINFLSSTANDPILEYVYWIQSTKDAL